MNNFGVRWIASPGLLKSDGGVNMHWIKTKIKHILYHNFTDKEFSRFMKLRALTCHLGCMPNDKQIASICPQKIYQSIVKVLASEGQSIGKVLVKDIEDATGVQEVKDYWKIKKRQQREKLHNVQETVKDMSSHKSRLDKTISDKIRKKDKTNVFKKPSLEEIKQYCTERNNSINPQSFTDFYESKGWMIGKNKMKDWRACVRNWETRDTKKPARDFETERKLAMIKKFHEEETNDN